ncbi:hypothetical protein ACIQOF_35715 [Streptomyces sp. NPDC091265]|uniref:hypothetical protein n=1 Tax=Streptomyces sp. NPDC091265 TaxID=3365977 RepID=UPI00380C6256
MRFLTCRRTGTSQGRLQATGRLIGPTLRCLACGIERTELIGRATAFSDNGQLPGGSGWRVRLWAVVFRGRVCRGPLVADRGDNREDAIGLLELFLPAAPDAEVMQGVSETAHALAYIIIAIRSFPDGYQWGRRTAPLSLAAEIQHRLLPASLACEAAQFASAGALEPADRVGGDTFDYVVDRDTVQLAHSLDRPDLIVRTRALHPREAARTLIAAVADGNHGSLQDDATVMCQDWHGIGHSHRDADTDADLHDAFASSPLRL